MNLEQPLQKIAKKANCFGFDVTFQKNIDWRNLKCAVQDAGQ
jgi:hypothetical protein